MDRMQVIEAELFKRQKPMNDVIDRGDSPVQQFYKNATVFVTGGSGFVGKHLIEKLFRSCAIKKMYILLRTKKGKTIQERLDTILSDPLYDLLREKQPSFADRIEPVVGDMADIKLGLKDADWKKLAREVTAIFHVGAVVRFDEPLPNATLTNVRATRDSLALGKECSNLKSFVYVSTAYTAATKQNIGKDVYEKFNPTPISPDILISLAEELDENRLNNMTNSLIEGWPNTYTFTKAVAEEQVRISGQNLPVCIVRPPIVLPAYYEPLPGWLDKSAINGYCGLIMGLILGALHVYHMDVNTKLPETPVDYVNNAVIAAGWDAAQRKKMGETEISIYTVSNKKYFIHMSKVDKILRSYYEYSTDKAVYMCNLIKCKNYRVYQLLTFLFHYIPAYVLDICCAIIGKRPKGIKSFVDIYKKIDKLSLIYEYFAWNEWGYRDDNVRAMLARMTEADKAIYNCDLATLNLAEYILVWILGIRKYIIKDGINKSDLGYQKQKIFKAVNYVVLTLYAYLLWCIFSLMYNIVRYLFSCL